MADNITLNSGTGGAVLRTDDDGTAHWQYVKVSFGADNTQTPVGSTASNPLPVALSDTDNAVLDSIDSAVNGTLTVAAHAVTNAGTFAVQESNRHTADFDTGAGTDTTSAFGIAVPANGGAAVVPGDATAGLKVDLGADNDVTVTGTVTANLGATDNAVLDAIAASLVDVETNTDYGATTGNGTAAGSLRVTLASDSTGVITANLGATDNAVLDSIDSAVNGTLTVDGSGVTQPVSGTVTANLGATDNAVLDSIDTAANERSSSHYRNIDANAEDAVKASAGVLYWIHCINRTAAIAYLHLYDAATGDVTPGTTTPDFTFAIPTQGDTNGAGFAFSFGGRGHAFATAITLVCTTTLDGSTGDPGTNGVIVNAGYA